MYTLCYDGSIWLFWSMDAAFRSAVLTWGGYGPLIGDETLYNGRTLRFGTPDGYKEIFINRCEPIASPRYLED